MLRIHNGLDKASCKVRFFFSCFNVVLFLEISNNEDNLWTPMVNGFGFDLKILEGGANWVFPTKTETKFKRIENYLSSMKRTGGQVHARQNKFISRI